MTLIITLLAAAIATIAWYVAGPNSQMKIGVLALMYWGAGLMWTVDGIASLLEGAAMIDDALLGLVIVTTGLIAWALYLLLKDPKGMVRKSLAA